ncbi:MAG TPA: hypothetical protein VII98_11285 [Solirubrobacteraceae bacterium]
MSPRSSIQPPTGTARTTNGTAAHRRFAPGDLAGLAVIALVGVLVSATIGFHSIAAPIVLLLVLGGLVLAEQRLVVPARNAAPRHAASPRAGI